MDPEDLYRRDSDGGVSLGQYHNMPGAYPRPRLNYFPLFALPPEIRDMIYDYAFVKESTFEVDTNGDDEEDEEEAVPLPQQLQLLPQPHQLAPAHIQQLQQITQQQLQYHQAQLVHLQQASQQQVPPQQVLQQQQQPQQQIILAANPPAGQAPRPAPKRIPHASVTSRPASNILLANKTIRHEYEQRSQRAITLNLKDNEYYAFTPFNVPQQASLVHHAEIHLILFCALPSQPAHTDKYVCQACEEIESHRAWIAHLLTQLENLISFTLDVYLCYDRYPLEGRKKFPCEAAVMENIVKLLDLPKLKSLLLSKYNYTAQPDLTGKKVPMFGWKSEKRLRRQPAIESVKPKDAAKEESEKAETGADADDGSEKTAVGDENGNEKDEMDVDDLELQFALQMDQEMSG